MATLQPLHTDVDDIHDPPERDRVRPPEPAIGDTVRLSDGTVGTVAAIAHYAADPRSVVDAQWEIIDTPAMSIIVDRMRND